MSYFVHKGTLSGGGGVSLGEAGSRGDGYVAFFIGSDDGTSTTIAGDNDFVFDRENNSVTMRSLKIQGGQVYIVTPGTLTTAGTSITVDWDLGNFQTIDLEGASGDVTLTFINGQASGSYSLEIIQGSVDRDITWPAEVLWEGSSTPTISSGENSVDVYSAVCNGTVFYSTILQNMS